MIITKTSVSVASAAKMLRPGLSTARPETAPTPPTRVTTIW